jgi:hypothetical protein
MATHIAGYINNLKVLCLIDIRVTIKLILDLNQLIIKGNTILSYIFENGRIREFN